MNAKPKMETINDQKREERVAGFIEGLWGVRCHKLPVSYGLDYWCESKESSFWMEDTAFNGLVENKDKVYDVRFGTIAEPQLPEDSEPYIHLHQTDLVCLSDSPLGFDRDELGLT